MSRPSVTQDATSGQTATQVTGSRKSKPIASGDSGDGWVAQRGDCLELLRSIADDSIDVTIMDPPYEAEAHTKGRRTKVSGWRQAAARGESAGVAQAAPLPFVAITNGQREAVSRDVGRVTRRWIVVFCQVEAAMLWAGALRSADHNVEYIRTMIWTKPNAQPQFTGDRPGHGYESIVVAHRKGRKRWNGGGRLGVFDHCTVAAGSEKAAHPTTKPLPLMRELVSLFSDPDELILDPFMGSGSTLVAAKQLGRRGHGIELDAGYYEIACRRLRGESARLHESQTEMFSTATGASR